MENINLKPILSVKDLRVSFKTNTGTVKAVRGIGFDLYRGKTLAIVGESGSGKSVTSKAILGILSNNKIIENGEIIYDGKDLLSLPENKFTKIRGVKISMIFQDPLSALNPIMKVGKQLTEAMYLENRAHFWSAKLYILRVNHAIVKHESSKALKKIKYYTKNVRIVDSLSENLINNCYPYFEKTAIKETKLYVENLNILLECAKEFKETYLANEKDNINTKAVIKELKTLKKPIKNCKNFFAFDADDVIDVYISLAKKYLQSMEKADLLKAEMDQLFIKHGVNDFFDLPAKERAKQREVILPRSHYYELLINLTEKLINHVNQLIKFYSEVRREEVIELIKYYAKLSHEVGLRFTLSNKFFNLVNKQLETLDPKAYEAIHKLNKESRDADLTYNELLKNYSSLFESIYDTEKKNYISLLNNLKFALDNYRNVNLSNKGLNLKTINILKDVSTLEKTVQATKFSLEILPDANIVTYLDTIKSVLNEINDFNKNEKRIQSLFIKYNVDNYSALPEEVKSKQEGSNVTFDELYNKLAKVFADFEIYVDNVIKELEASSNITKLLKQYSAISLSKHKWLTPGEAKYKAIELMKEVGIPQPEKRYYQYPFEFSGGMRQRIVIAIALSGNPEVLICDEPTTALDVTIQAQILELIQKLKEQKNLSIIFITHDLGVVANMADDIAVMYAGKIVEYGSVYDIFYDPRHPYTWALLSSMPDLNTQGKLDAIPGTPPNMLLPPKGDAFAARNSYAVALDYKQEPPFFKISDSHYVKTWLAHKDAIDVTPPKTVINRIRKSLAVNPKNTPSYELKKNSVLEIIKGGK